MLERFKAMIAGTEPLPAIALKLGFLVLDVQPGAVKVFFKATNEFANPQGTLHGGVLCDLSDLAMGMSFGSTLESEESFTTLEMKISFLKPVWNDELTAHGRVIKRGRNIGLTECEILDGRGSLVAKASSTCMVLRGCDAKRR
jgi:uncharacterized protein (TIGR00369 family)